MRTDELTEYKIQSHQILQEKEERKQREKENKYQEFQKEGNRLNAYISNKIDANGLAQKIRDRELDRINDEKAAGNLYFLVVMCLLNIS